MDLTNENGDIYLVVAKNDSDTKLSIEVRVAELNSEWYYEPDLFTSTDLLLKSKTEASKDGSIKDREKEIPEKKPDKKPDKKPATKKTSTASSKEFEIDSGVLKKYKGKEEVVTIPDGVKTIDKMAFDGNKTIKKLIMSDSVTSIKDAAFRYCSNLEEVVFSKKLTSIAPLAFASDISLRSVDLSNTKIKTIRKKASLHVRSWKMLNCQMVLKLSKSMHLRRQR